jgi:hypothetical protein
MSTPSKKAIAEKATQKAWDEGLIDQNGKTPLKVIIQAAIEQSNLLRLCDSHMVAYDLAGAYNPRCPLCDYIADESRAAQPQPVAEQDLNDQYLIKVFRKDQQPPRKEERGKRSEPATQEVIEIDESTGKK